MLACTVGKNSEIQCIKEAKLTVSFLCIALFGNLGPAVSSTSILSYYENNP